MTREEQHPEHAKLEKIAHKSQIIGEFLDSLPDGLVLARWKARFGEDYLQPAGLSINRVLEMYFGIDGDKLEAEKLQMLGEIREAHAERESVALADELKEVTR